MTSRPHYPPLPEPLAVPVYDNHTHLDPDTGHGGREEHEPIGYAEQLDLAVQAGVRGVVQVGCDIESARFSAALAAKDTRVLAAVAIHPNDAVDYQAAGRLDDAIAVIDELAAQPRVRAIGETGLDYFRTDEPGWATQQYSFEAHIDLAKKHRLALQIHDRDAHDDVIATLLRVGAPERTVFHCFSGDATMAKLCADNGWYLSFAGTVTFKNAEGLRDALAVVPADRILIETDAPYLTPVPFRGRANAPYLIPHTLRFMANHRGSSADELATQISANTERVYGSWSDTTKDTP